MYSFKQIKEDIFNFEGIKFESQGNFYEMYVDNLTFPKLYSEYFNQPLNRVNITDNFINRIKTFFKEIPPKVNPNLMFTKTFAVFASEDGVHFNMVGESEKPVEELNPKVILGQPGTYVKAYLVTLEQNSMFGVELLVELSPTVYH